jgi:hypothetical protein
VGRHDQPQPGELQKRQSLLLRRQPDAGLPSRLG